MSISAQLVSIELIFFYILRKKSVYRKYYHFFLPYLGSLVSTQENETSFAKKRKMTRFVKFMKNSTLLACKNLDIKCCISNGNKAQRCILINQPRYLYNRRTYGHGDRQYFRTNDKNNLPVLIGASLAALFGFFKNEEEKEHDLIKAIKRSILLIRVWRKKKNI